jgi:hypothetical protein
MRLAFAWSLLDPRECAAVEFANEFYSDLPAREVAYRAACRLKDPNAALRALALHFRGMAGNE